MPVARWEFWSLANMLISTRGEGAEAHADTRLNEALASRDSGEALVWREVIKMLPKLRQEQIGARKG